MGRALSRSGTDEAGRGSVIGPLVIASVLVDRAGARYLREQGVRDSKRVSPSRRKRLAPVIEQTSLGYVVTYIAPWNIDKYVRRRRKFTTLNRLEAEVVAHHIKELRPFVAYLDSPYPIPRVFRNMVKGVLGDLKVGIVSQNRSESAHVEVAAASVLAKVRRDEVIRELRAKLGDFGSGYPSDQRTRQFIVGMLNRGERPRYIRWSWRTIDRVARGSGHPSSKVSPRT